MESTWNLSTHAKEFAKRLKWSPDGKELLANMESGNILIFKKRLEECELSGKINGNSSGLNDFDWHPWMNSSLQGSDIFITSSKDSPIQLWSSDDSKSVCSWIAKDHLDQVANCLSLAFSPDGKNIISGGQDKLWLFDVNRPGDNAISVLKTIPKKRSTTGQSGLISCLNFRYDNTGVFAAGSFKGTIGIYDTRLISNCEAGSNFVLFNAHRHGVSQVEFLNDGWSILSSGRRDSCLKKWDLRMIQSNYDHSNKPIMEYYLPNRSTTNQRIYFDTSPDGKLFTGSQCSVIEYQIATGELLTSVDHFSDIVSSVSLSCDGIIAASSGSRKFTIINSDSDSDFEIELENSTISGSISLFRQTTKFLS